MGIEGTCRSSGSVNSLVAWQEIWGLVELDPWPWVVGQRGIGWHPDPSGLEVNQFRVFNSASVFHLVCQPGEVTLLFDSFLPVMKVLSELQGAFHIVLNDSNLVLKIK